ncbi:MAG: DUF3391 domain-containing protein, partial [Tepidimonas taiwanensis]|nr:DUF3391 domain-containing protein [Tepidimonas taiwanensis]
MPEPTLPLIPVSDLRVGHFVLLDLGWMAHPFPRNHFRITSPRQIDTIRRLGLSRVRIDPARSEFDVAPTEDPTPPGGPAAE